MASGIVLATRATTIEDIIAVADPVPARAAATVDAAAAATDPATTSASTTPPSTTSTTLPVSQSPAGTGEFTSAKTAGPRLGRGGSLRRFRVEVEDGLGITPADFAEAVDGVLGDARSWTGTGELSLQRTEGSSYDFKIVLASPETVDRLCAPLRTNGILSCHEDGKVILNHWRWLVGDDDFGSDTDLYRIYLVNHEVGHALGHDHVGCSEPGTPAPVMMQQTKSVGACRPNGWPLESER